MVLTVRILLFGLIALRPSGEDYASYMDVYLVDARQGFSVAGCAVQEHVPFIGFVSEQSECKAPCSWNALDSVCACILNKQEVRFEPELQPREDVRLPMRRGELPASKEEASSFGWAVRMKDVNESSARPELLPPAQLEGKLVAKTTLAWDELVTCELVRTDLYNNGTQMTFGLLFKSDAGELAPFIQAGAESILVTVRANDFDSKGLKLHLYDFGATQASHTIQIPCDASGICDVQIGNTMAVAHRSEDCGVSEREEECDPCYRGTDFAAYYDLLAAPPSSKARRIPHLVVSSKTKNYPQGCPGGIILPQLETNSALPGSGARHRTDPSMVTGDLRAPIAGEGDFDHRTLSWRLLRPPREEGDEDPEPQQPGPTASGRPICTMVVF